MNSMNTMKNVKMSKFINTLASLSGALVFVCTPYFIQVQFKVQQQHRSSLLFEIQCSRA